MAIVFNHLRKSWNHFEKEFCFKLGKSIPERTTAVMKEGQSSFFVVFVFVGGGVSEFHNFFLGFGLFHYIFYIINLNDLICFV